MLGIFLNKVGSFAKIFSLIVVLKVASTSSPDLENYLTFEAMIEPGLYETVQKIWPPTQNSSWGRCARFPQIL